MGPAKLYTEFKIEIFKQFHSNACTKFHNKENICPDTEDHYLVLAEWNKVFSFGYISVELSYLSLNLDTVPSDQ